MDYEKLKEVIAKQIKENGRREITGPVLQAVLMAMVDSLGEVYPHTYTDEEKAQARANIDALSNYDGEITKEKLSIEVQAILNDVANKQNISDATLATIAKTIVGAINEVYKGGLKDASIATSKIEDGAITDAKIASGAVTTPKIANDAVTTEKLKDGAITEPKLDTDLLNVITSAVQPEELASAIATALASYVAKADIVDTTGSATDKVMSQHGVTEAINGVTNKVTELESEIDNVKSNEEEIKNFIGFNPYKFNLPISSEVPAETLCDKIYNFTCEQGKTYVLYHKTTGTDWTHYVYLQKNNDLAVASRLQTMTFFKSEDYTTTEFTCNVEGGTKYIHMSVWSTGVEGQVDFFIVEKDSIIDKVEELEINDVKSDEEEIKNFIGFNPYNFNLPVSGEAPTINAKLINFNCEQGKTYVIYHKTTGTQWTHYVYLQNVWSQAEIDRLQTIEFSGSEDYTTTEFTCNVEGGTKYILATAYSNGNGGQVDFFIVEKDSIIDKVEELRTSGVDLSKIEAEIDDVRKGLYGGNIFDVNKKQYFKNLFIQANWASRNGGNTPHISPLVMLWFSDIHGSQYNYNRLIEFKNYFNEYIQASICTGDIVNDHYGDDFSYFTANDIMLVIGNHDVQDVSTGEHTHTGLEAYNTYFKDKISNWGVIQPENASTEGLCYYYKDFTDRGIRLIVLDKMTWNSAQNTWLQEVLSDAKNNNLAVICANHYPASIVKDTKCSFCSLYTDELGGMPTDLINSVESFINNGGEFICHLSGHTHADYYGIISGTTQISITIDCAYSAYDAWNDSDRVSGEKSADCFNILSIDTYDKTIKMFRVGVDRDRWLRHKGTMCVKYDTRELLWND